MIKRFVKWLNTCTRCGRLRYPYVKFALLTQGLAGAELHETSRLMLCAKISSAVGRLIDAVYDDNEVPKATKAAAAVVASHALAVACEFGDLLDD